MNPGYIAELTALYENGQAGKVLRRINWQQLGRRGFRFIDLLISLSEKGQFEEVINKALEPIGWKIDWEDFFNIKLPITLFNNGQLKVKDIVFENLAFENNVDVDALQQAHLFSFLLYFGEINPSNLLKVKLSADHQQSEFSLDIGFIGLSDFLSKLAIFPLAKDKR